MSSDINIRLAGQAGQGLQTTGNLLVQAFTRLGLYVIATQSYMSRVRGGLNWFDIRVSNKELFGAGELPDVLVALSQGTLDSLSNEIAKNGIILFDGKSEQSGVFDLPFTATAKEIAGSPLMANSVAAGAVLSILGYDVEVLRNFLIEVYEKRSKEIAEKNVNCLKAGVEMAEAIGEKIVGPDGDLPKTSIYNGATAMALSAATSGVKFISAYPMTPGTSTYIGLTRLADKYGIVSEQAEDELSAINMICGAVAAGVPSMTTTSGGGFALMTEAVSLAGMMELPILVMVSQRPGPATGLPTRTAQQDLNLVIYAGHGEFPKIVYAPGSVQQCYDIPRIALQIAHKYQSPAFILADQYIVDLKQNLPALSEEYDPIDRCIIVAEDDDYQRFEITESGVSPKAIYGGKGYVIYDSDEHTEDGHITEDLGIAVQMHDKRMRKQKGIEDEFIPPQWFGPDSPDSLIICWGSTYGPAREAVDILANNDNKVSMLHFSQVWPINISKVNDVVSSHKGTNSSVIFIEGNGTNQFAALCSQINLFNESKKISKYNGMHFTGVEIAKEIERV